MNLIPKINGKVSLTGGVCSYGGQTPVTAANGAGIPREGYVLTVEPEEIKIEESVPRLIQSNGTSHRETPGNKALPTQAAPSSLFLFARKPEWR